MMELGNLHLAIIMVTINSGKKHQRILKLVAKSGLMKEIFTLSQSLSTQNAYYA